MFVKSDIPQADNLYKVIETVEAVSEGAATDIQISEAIGYTDRQARYYRHAAEVLGFVSNNRNHAVLTNTGEKFVNFSGEERMKLITKAIISNSFFSCLISFIEQQSMGFTDKDLVNYMSTITDKDTQATIERRSKTVIAWFEKLDIIENVGDYYKYNDKLIYDLEEINLENEIFPSTYDQEVDIKEEWFSIFELKRKIKQGKVAMSPDFQRNLVWKLQQKSKFIESIILNIPLPPLYFRKDLEGNYIVVDGLQRMSTLDEFLSNKFALAGLTALPQLNGQIFEGLDDKLQTRIEDRKLLIYNLQPQVPMKVVYDIFNRINTGGTILTRQEIRNCIFIGNATTLLKELAISEDFLKAIDKGISSVRMKDREAILRCLAFSILDYKIDYKNSMDEFLEKAMRKINTYTKDEIRLLKAEFLRVMNATYSVFGLKNFRLPSGFNRGRINIAILETIYFFFTQLSTKTLLENAESIKVNFYSLLDNRDFKEAIRNSTGSSVSVFNRFMISQQILSEKNI